jgi:hypothetical protein
MTNFRPRTTTGTRRPKTKRQRERDMADLLRIVIMPDDPKRAKARARHLCLVLAAKFGDDILGTTQTRNLPPIDLAAIKPAPSYLLETGVPTSREEWWSDQVWSNSDETGELVAEYPALLRFDLDQLLAFSAEIDRQIGACEYRKAVELDWEQAFKVASLAASSAAV